MLKIVDKAGGPRKTTTTNDIPVGQAFKGTIIGGHGHEYTGVFYKYSNEGSPYVLGLMPSRSGYNVGGHPAWTRCIEVKDYEPVELTVEVIPQ